MSEKHTDAARDLVFPILLRAHESPSFTGSPYAYRPAFREAFLAANPKGSYYAFDVTIHSETEVEFTAYDMRDNVYGGIGDKIWSGPAKVSPILTADAIDRAIARAAIERRQRELAKQEQAIIDGYAAELRVALAKAEEPTP